VLLDELGAGTDPGEGAALGSAVLEELADRGCHVLATTHLDGLKLFVAQDDRMLNGAVEFDLDRLRPAYRLQVGLPGRSFALEIASRLGIAPATIARARQLAGDSSAGVAALLDRLRALEQERAAAAESRAAAERLLGELGARRESLQGRADRLVAEIAADARRQAEAAVAALKQGQSIQAARRAIARIPLVAEERLKDLPALAAPGGEQASLPVVEPGQRVWLRHLGQTGTVLSVPSPDGPVEVQVSLGRVRVPLEKLFPASPATAARREAVITWHAGAGEDLRPEINVIGCTVEEAEAQVSRYLDDAALGGLSRVRIIHGKGTGRLRRGLAAFLQTHPLVAGFQLASFDEGGAGATVVELGARPSQPGTGSESAGEGVETA